jgi:hypothetical protein
MFVNRDLEEDPAHYQKGAGGRNLPPPKGKSRGKGARNGKDHQPYVEIAWNYVEDAPQHKGKGRTKGAAHPAQGGEGPVQSVIRPWRAGYGIPPVDIFTPE